MRVITVYAGNGFWTFCPAEHVHAHTTTLCDGCAARVSKGLMPACAIRCSMKCLLVGRAADMRFALEEKRLRAMGEMEFA